MTFKEMLIFTYGMLMGTSMPYLKPSRRYLWPSFRMPIDAECGVFLGGSGICAVVSRGGEALIINVNQGDAAIEWRRWCDERGVDLSRSTVVLSSTLADFSGGLESFAGVGRVLCGDADVKVLRKDLGAWSQRVEIVRDEIVLKIAGEVVRVVPLGPAASSSDLAVFLENRQILFTGPLVYNQVHPPLYPRAGFAPEVWADKVEQLLARFSPRVVVPGEGELCDVAQARVFVRYLRDLMNADVEFSECRRQYDWMEIPRQTSLEENFDLLRDKTKTFTSVSSLGGR